MVKYKERTGVKKPPKKTCERPSESLFAQEHFIKEKRQESLAAWKPNIKKEAVGQDFYTVLYIHEQKKKLIMW